MKNNSQASKIRGIVLNLLKEDTNNILQRLNEYGNVNAIKYIDLKNYLQNNFDFTEGAIVGCLNTITERENFIHKAKTKSGTFFYYSHDIKKVSNTSAIEIIYSEEFKSIIDHSELMFEDLSAILKNTAKSNYYLNVTDTDLNHLREILEGITHTQQLIKKYQFSKSFDNAESNIQYRFNDDLPF